MPLEGSSLENFRTPSGHAASSGCRLASKFPGCIGRHCHTNGPPEERDSFDAGVHYCLVTKSVRVTLEVTLKTLSSLKFFGMLTLCAFALGSMRGAQAPAAAADQPPNACSVQAFCYDAAHFTATITSFRTSTVNGYKLIDTSIRFQNKTNGPVVLGYVQQSGFATDDRGNRSIVGGPNGFRGIGLVVGNNFDPKLVVRPLSGGEAQFELVLQGSPQIVGFHYVLDITVAEIKTLEGNQYVLDGEFPLHFEGLTNGVSQGAGSFAGAPDGLANAVSNLRSIFGKKKGNQNAAAAANSAASTAAAVNAAATSAAGQSSSAAAISTPGQAAASPTAPQASTSNQANAANYAPAPQPSEQQQLRQGSAKAAPQRVASVQPAAEIPHTAAAEPAEPWTPPADKAAEAAALVDPLKLPEVMKMPDVVGVHLGMTEQQALQILHGQYPRERFQEIPASGLFPTNPKADYGFNVLPTNEIATDVVVSLTAPPSRQVVWHIVRFTRRLHANHANVLATLREKYGKESFAGYANGSKTSDDQNVGMLFWIFDERGNRAPMPSAQAFGSNDINFCLGRGIAMNPGPRIPIDEVKDPNWCASFVGVVAEIDPTEIVENTTVAVMDMRLANRTANAYVAWKRDADAKARTAEIEKSKKNKPVF